jgi:hypothetical protein
VLDRIDVDVVDVMREIAFISDRVLPIAPLLDAAFAVGQAQRKAGLDQAPARGEIRIALGHGPDDVEVIGQHDHRLDREGDGVDASLETRSAIRRCARSATTAAVPPD